MTDYREIIRLHSLKFSNVSIANSLCCSRNTVSEVLKLAEKHSLEWPIPETLSNKDIEYLFYPNRGNNEGRRLPDYEYVYNELAKPGVTLSLLWAEYCAKCEAEHTIPYQHSQFNDKYHAYAASKKATLRIKRKPGETMEVDWVGDTLKVYDAASCCDIPAYIFVAVLPCSLYGYAEAFPDMKSNHWIEAHIHAYSFFGGVTRILVPDNLKTGVIKNTRAELVLNRSYHEMAEHYGTAIIPARPVKPKDYRRKNVIGNLSLKKSNNCIFRLNRCFSLPIIIYSRPQKWRRYSSLPFHFFSGYDTTLPSESFAGNAS